ncbi:hypothetical protein AB0M58_14290 [Streptomyces bobili]|uniref:hypothetical protein n=1 Tax=Streptomyces bobili TaxID=67280 RepID=UPI0034307448
MRTGRMAAFSSRHARLLLCGGLGAGRGQSMGGRGVGLGHLRRLPSAAEDLLPDDETEATPCLS